MSKTSDDADELARLGDGGSRSCVVELIWGKDCSETDWLCNASRPFVLAWTTTLLVRRAALFIADPSMDDAVLPIECVTITAGLSLDGVERLEVG